MESFAFKDAVREEFSIHPKYIGLFAIQGFAETGDVIAANFDSFAFQELPCQ